MIDKSEQINPIDELAEEFTERHRRGERPTIAEYADSHPDLADEIRQLFPSIVAMERLKHRKLTSGNSHLELKVRELQQLGDYRIIREIGRGGMGIVYEAEQESLGRHVAVKVLPEQSLLNEKHLERFQREAQTAAKLNHTNIVPIFGVGEEDGLPYIVMQYIRGVSLDDVLREMTHKSQSDDDSNSTSSGVIPVDDDLMSKRFSASQAIGALFGNRSRVARQPKGVAATETTYGMADTAALGDDPPTKSVVQSDDSIIDIRPLSNHRPSNRGYWRGLGRIGVQVADALAYAHSQNVLHRDIKPGNLLVDEKGIVCVTDFGLAKVMTNEPMSRSRDIVGTLRYMAPEQYDGQCDARSDIYSLGLTLYELATLRPAFDDEDLNQLIHNVTQSAPPKPRSLNPHIPRDLETIILKSISREPAARYESAGQLAEDFQRFVEDRPIRARRAGAIEQLWRWGRRNPAVASLSALLMVVFVCAFFLVTWEWRKTESERARAESQKTLAESEATRAEAEKIRAENEGARAERNLSMALESMDEVFDRLASNWMAHPSDPDVLEDGQAPEFQLVANSETVVILQDALKFYDRFAEQNASNPRLQHDAARANRRVGDIHQRLGQLQKAAEAYRSAIGIYQKLSGEFPNDRQYATSEAATCNELGFVLQRLLQHDEAEKHLRRAMSILKASSAGESASADTQFELAQTYNLLSHMFRQVGFGKKVENYRGLAVKLLDQLVEREPENARYRLAQAKAYRNLYPMFSFANRRNEAATARAKALAIVEQLVSDFPNVPDYQCELSEMLAMTNTWGRDESQRKEAESSVRRAVQLATQLADQYPTIPRYRASLASAKHQLSVLLRRTDEKQEAEQLQRDAITVYTQLAGDFDSVPTYRMFLAMSHASLADILKDAKQHKDARVEFEKAIHNQELYLKSRGESHYGKSTLARQYQDLAKTLFALNLHDEGMQASQKSKAIWAEIQRPNPWRYNRKGDKKPWPPSKRGMFSPNGPRRSSSSETPQPPITPST